MRRFFVRIYKISLQFSHPYSMPIIIRTVFICAKFIWFAKKQEFHIPILWKNTVQIGFLVVFVHCQRTISPDTTSWRITNKSRPATIKILLVCAIRLRWKSFLHCGKHYHPHHSTTANSVTILGIQFTWFSNICSAIGIDLLAVQKHILMQTLHLASRVIA